MTTAAVGSRLRNVWLGGTHICTSLRSLARRSLMGSMSARRIRPARKGDAIFSEITWEQKLVHERIAVLWAVRSLVSSLSLSSRLVSLFSYSLARSRARALGRSRASRCARLREGARLERVRGGRGSRGWGMDAVVERAHLPHSGRRPARSPRPEPRSVPGLRLASRSNSTWHEVRRFPCSSPAARKSTVLASSRCPRWSTRRRAHSRARGVARDSRGNRTPAR